MQQTLLQAFQWYSEGGGKWWNLLAQKATGLKELGFNLAWLPPAFKGASGGTSVGYDPYDLYDLGEFLQKGSMATKYGNREAYMFCVQSLKRAGIGVVPDMVMNHKAGGDGVERIRVLEVDPDDRNKIIGKPQSVRAFTKFTFPGRKKKYSSFEWDYTCFTGIDRLVARKKSGVFKILNGYGRETLWQNLVGNERGNYDYLMFNDVEFRNPSVREELINWGKWYYDQIHFDGVRLDAVKHMPPAFIEEWLTTVRKYAGNNFFAVAEYWDSGSLQNLVDYAEATHHQTKLFDVPLQAHFHTASEEGQDYDMRQILKGTLADIHPELAVTFVSNHDTQLLQALQSVVRHEFKPLAYALILLRKEGVPTVFYPDLYGAHYTDVNRKGEQEDVWLKQVDGIERLLQARAEFAYGKQQDYFDDKNCLGFVRLGDEQHRGCAVVLSNGEAGSKIMDLSPRYGNCAFIDLLGNDGGVVKTEENGRGLFRCYSRSVSVWVPAV